MKAVDDPGFFVKLLYSLLLFSLSAYTNSKNTYVCFVHEYLDIHLCRYWLLLGNGTC
jgi:hypothetical protein